MIFSALLMGERAVKAGESQPCSAKAIGDKIAAAGLTLVDVRDLVWRSAHEPEQVLRFELVRVGGEHGDVRDAVAGRSGGKDLRVAQRGEHRKTTCRAEIFSVSVIFIL